MKSRLFALIGGLAASAPGLAFAQTDNPANFCSIVLKDGAFNRNETSFNSALYTLNHDTICQKQYSNYEAAKSLKASGGFDIPGALGISGSDDQASSEYSAKWATYCHASYSEVQANSELEEIGQYASTAVLSAFDTCVNTMVNASQVVQYVTPLPDGAGFIFFIQKNMQGSQTISVSDIKLIDTTTKRTLPASSCSFNGSPLVPHRKVSSQNSNQLQIVCLKPQADSVTVVVNSSVGDFNHDVPASPPASPPILSRVQTLEAQVAQLQAELAPSTPDVKKVCMIAGVSRHGPPPGWTWGNYIDILSGVDNKTHTIQHLVCR